MDRTARRGRITRDLQAFYKMKENAVLIPVNYAYLGLAK